jgi:hypothetical protein
MNWRAAMSSPQVSWWDVHTYVQPLLEALGDWPMAGTPEWCVLADDDPAKLAAIYDAARQWALRVETAQEARAEASRDVSAAENWPVIATEIFHRRISGYIPRRTIA